MVNKGGTNPLEGTVLDTMRQRSDFVTLALHFHHQVSKSHVLEVDGLPGNTESRAGDKCPILVDDIDNDTDLILVRTHRENHDAANLDETLEDSHLQGAYSVSDGLKGNM